jgi:uncharacterized protein YndB with AHSA1/START domain
MPDIVHDFPVSAPPERVFASLSDPAVLDAWWTLRSSGEPRVGATYELFFGEPYDWRATVTRCEPCTAFELTITKADQDWCDTIVSIDLAPISGGTQVRFAHRGWPEPNAHYRTSSFCWAMYLRLMKRHVETGERVPYNIRLDV